MFLLATFIGIFSYVIFFLGISGLFYKTIIISVTVIFFGAVLFWKKANFLATIFSAYSRFRAVIKRSQPGKHAKKSDQFIFLFICLLIFQICVNFIGVLGPELGFDALWYHLTLPKIWLHTHTISYIPGGLLYYSVMPKLAETLYVVGLSFGNETLVKLIHFSFGLLTCFALYKLQRRFFSPLIAMIGVVIFYSNLVVAWESSSAYIDLVRTFFEVMALWGFVNWWESQKQNWLVVSAVMVGLAITTKLLAIGSLIIFSFLIIYYFVSHKKRFIDLFTGLFIYWITALIIPLPWFIFAFVNTGNPLYPLFSPYLMHLNNKVFDFHLLSPINFLSTSWHAFTQAADPISPLYIIFLPLFFVFLFKNKIKNNHIYLYSLFGFGFWYFTSQVEGTRMLMPYLPAFSFLCTAILSQILKNLRMKFLGNFLLVVIIFVSVISIGYRFVANAKYIPFLLRNETKAEFLSDHLNFSFADFYDTDGYFSKQIRPTDTVLLYGFHNLYYVNFPFIDATWVKEGDKFNYVATQKSDLPVEFKDWKLVYTNGRTMVKVYREK